MHQYQVNVRVVKHVASLSKTRTISIARSFENFIQNIPKLTQRNEGLMTDFRLFSAMSPNWTQEFAESKSIKALKNKAPYSAKNNNWGPQSAMKMWSVLSVFAKTM